MISVDFIKTTVDDLCRAQSLSYTSSVDFAREQRLAQDLLMSYYMNRFDEVDWESTQPFVREDLVYSANGIFSVPDSLRKIIQVDVFEQIGGVDNFRTALPLPKGAVGASSKSKLRRSRIGEYYYYHSVQGGIKIDIGEKRIRIRYLINPPDAVWGSTIDSVNIIETYNPVTSVNFEWKPKDFRLLVDCFLYFRGIKTENKDLLEFINNKNNILT
jgi:hypothetical protein